MVIAALYILRLRCGTSFQTDIARSHATYDELRPRSQMQIVFATSSSPYISCCSALFCSVLFNCCSQVRNRFLGGILGAVKHFQVSTLPTISTLEFCADVTDQVYYVAVHSNGMYYYYCYAVAVIQHDPATSIRSVFPLTAGCSQPRGMVMSSDASRAYVACLDGLHSLQTPGAGGAASFRMTTLNAFSSSLTVFGPPGAEVLYGDNGAIFKYDIATGVSVNLISRPHAFYVVSTTLIKPIAL